VQPHQHLEPGIAIGALQTDFLLMTADCCLSPISTTWIEALGRQHALRSTMKSAWWRGTR